MNNCSLCAGVGYLKRGMPSGVSLVPCYWSYWFVISWNFTNLLAWSIFSGEPILPDYSHVWSIQKQIQQYDNWESNQTWNCKVRNCYSNYWTACHIHSIVLGLHTFKISQINSLISYMMSIPFIYLQIIAQSSCDICSPTWKYLDIWSISCKWKHCCVCLDIYYTQLTAGMQAHNLLKPCLFFVEGIIHLDNLCVKKWKGM